MREIALFGEDIGHEKVIGALVNRIGREMRIETRLDWRSATGGHGKVAQEFKRYLRDLRQPSDRRPDLIVVATDANCKGLNERRKEIAVSDATTTVIHAIPDPHIERWLLLDSAAFRNVFGSGCDAPDKKCSRGRYKTRLIKAIHEAGGTPGIGGIEFAEDIVGAMDIKHVSQQDKSFQQFIRALRNAFIDWQ